MDVQHSVDNSPDPLLMVRERCDYNDAERWFSRLLQQRLEDLLQARRNRLDVLRRYPGQPDRLGVMQTPPDFPRDRLRLDVVEILSSQALSFVRSDSSSGPVSQTIGSDGTIFEVQTFPTKYPHIIIERTDRYPPGSADPDEISWVLRRVQNQRQQTQLNRLLDAASLVLDVIRAFR